MNRLIKYLKDKGFVAYTKTPITFPDKKTVLDNDNFIIEYKIQFMYSRNNFTSFSSTVSGGVDVRYLRDNIEIVFGLHEKGKPPTLISPRPFIDKGEYISCLYDDDTMNRIFNKFEPAVIYRAMFNKENALTL